MVFQTLYVAEVLVLIWAQTVELRSLDCISTQEPARDVEIPFIALFPLQVIEPVKLAVDKVPLDTFCKAFPEEADFYYSPGTCHHYSYNFSFPCKGFLKDVFF